MSGQTIHILVVDDSAVIRGLIARALREQVDFEVVDTAVNGKDAIKKLQASPQIEVIVLDIEMPEMDGLEALPELLRIVPDVKILMASTLTQRNADVSLRAMELGATDYVPKPTMKERESLGQFYRELVEKVRTLGTVTKKQRPQTSAPSRSATTAPVAKTVGASPEFKAIGGGITPEKDIRYPSVPVEAIAIASSTGGPQALNMLFEALKGVKFAVPLYITQHMPPTFTTLLAKNIAKAGDRDVREAEEGEVVMSGVTYVAPGDYHMCIKRDATQSRISLNQEPPVNFCRPAADPMIDSLREIHGKKLLVVVLTGMGADGRDASKRAHEVGATVIAQDEKSSVVWGMPGAVANLGICSALLDIAGVAKYLERVGGR